MGADYGIDAPKVVRNLFLVAAIALVLSIVRLTGLWSGTLGGTFGGVRVTLPLGKMAPWVFFAFASTSFWMLWDSMVGKVRAREWLLDRIVWTGRERVLDVGCGRGLMLVAAARRLTSGTATGIDIWQAGDLSGNRPESALTNAASEGVRDRVDVQTADMRKVPFPDATFDVVVSCAAIHNLYDPQDRRQAIKEIVRVLKPGGHALIDDIRHGAEYAAAFSGRGCTARHMESRWTSLLTTVATFGSLRPVKLMARKGLARESPSRPSAP
jgi:ubiquinone/menaquinone biosynthesis C-methylase UbiE